MRMLNLKTFESFNNSTYRKVTSGEASNVFQSRGGYEDIEKNELVKIKSVVDKIGGYGFYNTIKNACVSFYGNRTKKIVVITKCKDEWYYVMDDSTSPTTWYECDGLDGLEKCLISL